MLVGPWNCVEAPGQVKVGPLIEQGGSGTTVRSTSLVSMHPFNSMTVRRKVAVAEKTWAVVIKEFVKSMVAIPLMTLQVVDIKPPLAAMKPARRHHRSSALRRGRPCSRRRHSKRSSRHPSSRSVRNSSLRKTIFHFS